MRILLGVFVLLAALWAEPYEYRAFWVTRYELTSTENIALLVKTAAENNFNTLFVQVCGRGTAFYNSQLLPRDSSAPSADMLQYCLAEAKKYDLEVHAWINALYVWSDHPSRAPQQHIINKRPDWVVLRSDGVTDNNKYLDPVIPEVRAHLRAITKELSAYPLAGIHLDYIRYPGANYGSSAYARDEFQKKYNLDPLPLMTNKEIAIKLYGEATYNAHLEQWNAFRAQAVTELVKEIKTELAHTKLKLSAAVIAEPDQAHGRYLQDWAAWTEAGLLDLTLPMLYDPDTAVVERQIIQTAAMAEKYKQHFIIGLGAWRRPPQEVVDNILLVRRIREKLGTRQLAGIALFSYDSVSKQNNYLQRLKLLVFDSQAAVPTEKPRT
jgi:uncharacterized lipoprotein YddW (UPF0748 family)